MMLPSFVLAEYPDYAAALRTNEGRHASAGRCLPPRTL